MIEIETDPDRVFHALSEKNRRKIIELLHHGDSTLLEMSESFDISFQALSKHIKILEQSGVLIKKKDGKYRRLSLNRKALMDSVKWISYYSSFWNESFDQLEQLVNKNSPNATK